MSAEHKRPSRLLPCIAASLMLATSFVLVITRGEGLSTLVAVGLFVIALVVVALWRRSIPELVILVGVIYPPRLVLILLGGAVLMAGSELSIRAGRAN
jgi:drug/metabolite transporter (DMT)-like permease